METLSAIPFVIRFIWMIAAPAVFALVTIFRVVQLGRKTGAVYFRERKIPYVQFIFILVFSEQVVESLCTGIYESYVVKPGFSCRWEDVEGVIFETPSCIRFIHKSKGAFDFHVPQKQLECIKNAVLQHTTEIA